jgi:integrating conjugative element protein (TIGR03759 family)
MNAPPLTRCIAAALLALPLAAHAAPPMTATALDYTQVTDAALAAHWGLEKADAARYRRYMALEGRYFYTHLDPVMVLGIIETDPKRQARYAEHYLRAERQRIAAQTGFAQAVGDAQRRWFGQEKYLDFSRLPQAKAAAAAPSLGAIRDPARPRPNETPLPLADPTALQAGDTVDLRVAATCHAPCYDRLRALLRIPDITVALYGRDFADPTALVTWLETGQASWTAAERQAAAVRLQPRRFDPLVFVGVDATATPLALVRRRGALVGRLP